MNIKDIKNIKFLAVGKRSKVYTGKLNNKKIVIKYSNKAQKESGWLKILNKYGIGPRYIFNNKGFLIYEFVIGFRILGYFEYANKKDILKVLIEVMKQCRVLDKLKINKLEMHNPYKHILISKKVKLIDFERCYKTTKPKNVTQFGQFIISNKVYSILKNKDIIIGRQDFIKALKAYKKNYNQGCFISLLAFFKV